MITLLKESQYKLRSSNIDILAVVPARGGSKRLPRKNLLPLGGKALIHWTLDAANNSNVLDKVIVTSDDDEILSEAQRARVDYIKRPSDLATDTATTFDVLSHALGTLAAQEVFPARIMLLQPTSPLRTAEDIRLAVQKMNIDTAASVISVCRAEHSPLWCNTLDERGSMDSFLPKELHGRRSQDLPIYYRLNGAIYLAMTEYFIKHKGFFMPNSRAFVMASDRSIDIDSERDYKWASFLIGSGSKVFGNE